MKKILFLGVGTFVFVEIILRLAFGFCDSVLYREDPDYEYIAQPNQHRYRWGNEIQYNSLSMRSAEVDTTALIFLGFGDSVLNGGQREDQSDLASTLLTNKLTQINGQPSQFLNISSGSWGPENCYAYMKKHGDFNAQQIFLFVNSHDAYDNMTFQKVVGVNKSKPKKQYMLANWELIDRYLLPKILKSMRSGDEFPEASKKLTAGFNSFLEYSIDHGIPLTIVLHAERSEVVAGEYNDDGKRIIEFAEANNIPILKDLDFGIKKDDFRDRIHVNESGQKVLFDAVVSTMTQ